MMAARTEATTRQAPQERSRYSASGGLLATLWRSSDSGVAT
jgi:hypothetical protein